MERFYRRDAATEAEPLHQALASLGVHHVDALALARPELPDELDDRAQDACEALIAIADLAGGEWPVRGRAALVTLRGEVDENEETVGVRLLADTKTIFEAKDVDRLATSDLIAALHEDDEAGWSEWRKGAGLNPRTLARVLAGYGIRSRTVRLPAGDTPKGYMRASFEDAWNRYLPVSASLSATPPQASSHAGLTRGGNENTKTYPPRLEANSHAGCGGVADTTAETGGNGDPGTVDEAEVERLADLARDLQAGGCRCDAPLPEDDDDLGPRCAKCGRSLSPPRTVEEVEREEAEQATRDAALGEGP